MNWSRTVNVIGFTLLGVCFGISLFRVAALAWQEIDPERVFIRVAHNVQEDDMQAGIEALADDYMRLHPGVFVKQIVVPKRVYQSWVHTSLVGGTAPDIIHLRGGVDHLLSRYCRPIRYSVEEPNPYNVGTDLEGVKWRETFIDNLELETAYNQNLCEYYGIPIVPYTIRLYYNKELLREVIGEDKPPTTYGEFINLCKAVQIFAERTGRTVVPVAGYENESGFLRRIMSTQTQRLGFHVNPTWRMRLLSDEVGQGYVEGRWNLRSNEIRLGLQLLQEVGGYFQRGFRQQRRDDAIFYFAQQKALLVATESMDAQSVKSQAPFETGLITIPVPEPSHPVYGQQALGLSTELSNHSQFSFFLTRRSKFPEIALDFMKFISSKKSAEKFVEVSGRVSSVVGVEPRADTAIFAPLIDNTYPGGFSIQFGTFTRDLVDAQVHLLFNENTTIDDFLDAIEPLFDEAAVEDLFYKASTYRVPNTRLHDSRLGAFWYARKEGQLEGEMKPEMLDNLISEILEVQTDQSSFAHWSMHQVFSSNLPPLRFEEWRPIVK